MNIFNKVTLRSLLKNKTRTIVTVIGIMLSAALICAVTTSISSLMNFGLKNMIYDRGDWHGSTMSVDRDTVDKVSTAAEVEAVVYNRNIGYAVAESGINISSPYLYIIGAGEGYENTMPIHIISGGYPSSEGEILLPEHLNQDSTVEYKPGDTLTLDIGERVQDGVVLDQTAPYDSSEKLMVRETRTYTVSGIYERPSFERYESAGYTAITLDAESAAEGDTYDIYFKMKDPKSVYSFMEDNQLGTGTNNSVLMFYGATRYDNFYSVIYGLAAVVIGLIMFGSVSLIYNAFSISVSERTKQFGLLSSVGATKRQLRRSVFFEAFSVSMIGIPLGILVGIGGIGITLSLIGDKFTSLGNFEIPMSICVSPLAVVLACGIAVITVLISAWIPSKRATRVSAVEAIRQNSDIAVKAKSTKTSKILYKLFGLPGMLASKYFKVSRKKYRATIISLFMSVVLFVSAASFTGYFTEIAEASFSTNSYDLFCNQSYYDVDKINPEELLQKLSAEKHIKKSSFSRYEVFESEISRNYLNKEYLEKYAQLNSDDGSTEVSAVNVPVAVLFADDESFREMLRENGLREKDYTDAAEPLAVAVDGNTFFDREKEKLVTTNILRSDDSEIGLMRYKQIDGYRYSGDFEYDDEENKLLIYRSEDDPDDVRRVPEAEYSVVQPLRIGKVLHKPPYFVTTGGYLLLIYPYSFISDVLETGELGSQYITSVQYCFTSSDHNASYTEMTNILRAEGLNFTYLTDVAKYDEQNRNIATIVNVFAYGFIIMISLIAAANVFNTISTNISLRRREFAMLKSVGMTRRGFNGMMNFECLLYGSRSLLYGLPVSAGITYLIYRTVTAGYETGYRLPWGAIGIAAVSVFAVVFATMLYSMRKIKADNPIDALKNENL